VTLAKRVKKAIVLEQKIRYKKNKKLIKVVEKYNSLKSKGLIEDDKYNISKPDLIGHSIYGHAVI